MLLLGRWQLGRGEASGSLQNYAYALEWALFAAFALFCFWRLLNDVDEDDGRAQASSAVLLPRPVAATEEPPDDELAAYNAYLARLNGQV